MSTNLQSGVTALHIIAILAVFAVLFGIASTFMADSQPETTDIAATAADTTKTQSPIEEMAQTKAERETALLLPSFFASYFITQKSLVLNRSLPFTAIQFVGQIV